MNIKIILAAGLIGILQACGGKGKVEVGNKTTMTVNQVFDGGKVIRGEVIEAKFVIENTGDFPLIIGEVRGTCNCTVTNKPEKPIEPGEEGIVSAYVTTLSLPAGPINKVVNIVANTEPSRTEVVVKGNVIEK